MAEPITFKNTYVINMNELKKRPFDCLQKGALLPVEQKNGEPGTADLVLFSEHADFYVKRMIREYPSLSQTIGEQDARTIIVYLSKAQKPIMTLFPTNETDIITDIWNDVDDGVLPDATAIIDNRTKLIKQFKEIKQIKK